MLSLLRGATSEFQGAEKVKSFHYITTAHDHLNALRLWWHIDPRDPPAPQSLPHNHDLHVGHPRASPAPSLSSPRSVHGVTRVVPAPKGNKTKDKVCIRRIFKERRGSSRKCRPDLFPSVLRFFASFLTFPDRTVRLTGGVRARVQDEQRKKERKKGPGKIRAVFFQL